jgi:hypothetical protein
MDRARLATLRSGRFVLRRSLGAHLLGRSLGAGPFLKALPQATTGMLWSPPGCRNSCVAPSRRGRPPHRSRMFAVSNCQPSKGNQVGRESPRHGSRRPSSGQSGSHASASRDARLERCTHRSYMFAMSKCQLSMGYPVGGEAPRHGSRRPTSGLSGWLPSALLAWTTSLVPADWSCCIS